MIVRHMAGHDATAVSQLLAAVINSTTHYTPVERAENVARYSEAELRVGEGIVLVAIEGDEIVGALAAENDAGPLYVRWVVVRESRRNGGVAGRLLDAIVAWADKEGAHKVYCDVVFANVAMATALSRAGFRPAGVQWHYEVTAR